MKNAYDLVIVGGGSAGLTAAGFAFQLGARAAFREAFLRSRPAILEPIMAVEVEMQTECQGPVIGDNLSVAILTNSGNGVVHDAAVRDLDGIRELKGFCSFVRGSHPSFASPTILLAGVNCPIRIGAATCMPGDVVLGRHDGVVFVPPHLAEQVVKTSEVVGLRDRFGKQRLREAKYTPGQIDTRWTDDIERDFSAWLDEHQEDLPIPRSAIQELLKERTW